MVSHAGDISFSPQNNKSYKKLPKDTIHAPEGYSTNDFRDPQVIRMDEYDEYWMLVGGKIINPIKQVTKSNMMIISLASQ